MAGAALEQRRQPRERELDRRAGASRPARRPRSAPARGPPAPAYVYVSVSVPQTISCDLEPVRARAASPASQGV